MFHVEGWLHGECLGPNQQPRFIAFIHFIGKKRERSVWNMPA